jgi:hypothetical protein
MIMSPLVHEREATAELLTCAHPSLSLGTVGYMRLRGQSHFGISIH